MPLRVLLADDHPMIRGGIRAVLEATGFKVVGEAADGRDAVRKAAELRPDVAVFDIGMPELNGIEAARAARRAVPNLGVLLLTVHTEDIYVVEALRAGVGGYVLKRQAAEDLIHAIQDVHRGDVYVSPGVSWPPAGVVRGRSEQQVDVLTAREREVLRWIAEGYSTKQVASTLCISVKTVETHRSHIMDKLGIRETAGLIRYALRRGLVSL